jgi:Amt family ammonium transporter
MIQRFLSLLAIVSVYFRRLWTLATRWPFDPEARRFLIGLLVAFAPAVVIGFLGAVIPFIACTKIKSFFRYDDALDVFGVHGVGGTVGVVLTGVFATTAANPNLANNLGAYVGHSLWLQQLKALGLTLGLAVGGTLAIALALKFSLGLRPTVEAEQEGLDLSEHGEEGYIFEAKG